LPIKVNFLCSKWYTGFFWKYTSGNSEAYSFKLELPKFEF